MRFRPWLLFLFAGCLTFHWVAPAAAQGAEEGTEEAGDSEPQTAEEARIAQARASFIAGSQAAEEGRWADSLSQFQEAYLLSGVPTALYNAAMALRALGRHREARDAFDQLVRNHADSPAAGPAQEKRDEEAARVAVLTLTGLDPEGEYELRLDGRRIEIEVAPEIDVEADPGPRALIAEREGYETWAWEGTLGDGETRRLEITMVELEDESGGGVLRSPIFWIVVGAVVVGAGVGVGIWLQNDAQLDPTYSDNALQI